MAGPNDPIRPGGSLPTPDAGDPPSFSPPLRGGDEGEGGVAPSDQSDSVAAAEDARQAAAVLSAIVSGGVEVEASARAESGSPSSQTPPIRQEDVFPYRIRFRNGEGENFPILSPDPEAVELEDYRRTEINRVLDALRKGARIVAVTGQPGTGKTEFVATSLRNLLGAEGSGFQLVTLKPKWQDDSLPPGARLVLVFDEANDPIFRQQRIEILRKVWDAGGRIVFVGGAGRTPDDQISDLTRYAQWRFSVEPKDVVEVRLLVKPLNRRQTEEMLFGKNRFLSPDERQIYADFVLERIPALSRAVALFALPEDSRSLADVLGYFSTQFKTYFLGWVDWVNLFIYPVDPDTWPRIFERLKNDSEAALERARAVSQESLRETVRWLDSGSSVPGELDRTPEHRDKYVGTLNEAARRVERRGVVGHQDPDKRPVIMVLGGADLWAKTFLREWSAKYKLILVDIDADAIEQAIRNLPEAQRKYVVPDVRDVSDGLVGKMVEEFRKILRESPSAAEAKRTFISCLLSLTEGMITPDFATRHQKVDLVISSMLMGFIPNAVVGRFQIAFREKFGENLGLEESEIVAGNRFYGAFYEAHARGLIDTANKLQASVCLVDVLQTSIHLPGNNLVMTHLFDRQGAPVRTLADFFRGTDAAKIQKTFDPWQWVQAEGAVRTNVEALLLAPAETTDRTGPVPDENRFANDGVDFTDLYNALLVWTGEPRLEAEQRKALSDAIDDGTCRELLLARPEIREALLVLLSNEAFLRDPAVQRILDADKAKAFVAELEAMGAGTNVATRDEGPRAGRKIRGVILDLYRTLLWVREWRYAYEKLLSRVEHPPTYAELMTRYFKSPEALLESLGDLPDGVADEFLDNLRVEIETTEAYPEVMEVLMWLFTQGYRVALVSNLASPYHVSVDNLGLSHFFSAIIYSDEAGIMKPDPLIFGMALTAMGLMADEVVVVGDSIRDDMKGAEAAGIQGIHLDRHGRQEYSPRISDLTGLRDYLEAVNGPSGGSPSGPASPGRHVEQPVQGPVIASPLSADEAIPLGDARDRHVVPSESRGTPRDDVRDSVIRLALKRGLPKSARVAARLRDRALAALSERGRLEKVLARTGYGWATDHLGPSGTKIAATDLLLLGLAALARSDEEVTAAVQRISPHPATDVATSLTPLRFAPVNAAVGGTPLLTVVR